MTRMAGMLDAICPVTRLAIMMSERNDNRGGPAAQANEGKEKAMQKQSFGLAAAGFATHGSEQRIGFFKVHGWKKSALTQGQALFTHHVCRLSKVKAPKQVDLVSSE